MINDAKNWRDMYALQYAIDPEDIEKISADFTEFFDERGVTGGDIIASSFAIERLDGQAITTEVVADSGRDGNTLFAIVAGLIEGQTYFLRIEIEFSDVAFARSVRFDCRKR